MSIQTCLKTTTNKQTEKTRSITNVNINI